MTGVKIIDRAPREQRRRIKLWECFGKVAINPTDIKDGRQAYYAIVQTQTVEKLLTDEVKHVFNEADFEIITPIEFNALKSIVVRHLDRAILEYNDEEIIQLIKTENDWAEADSIYKITNTGRLLKIKFKSTEMVSKALERGMVVAHQWVPARNIEREVYIRLTPCYNCYQYTHKTKDCPRDRMNLCANCSASGHKMNECRETPKCINCGGLHRTLASACQVRKDLIKERAKSMRERSRSRSRARNQDQTQHRQTYAAAAGNINVEDLNMDNEQMQKLVAKILTSIIFSQCMETLTPGTFQTTVDEMFRINGLPRVKFPVQKVNEGLKKMYEDTMRQQTTHMHGEDDRDRENERARKDRHHRERDTEYSPETTRYRRTMTEDEERLASYSLHRQTPTPREDTPGEGTDETTEETKMPATAEEYMEIPETSKRPREEKTPTQTEKKKTKGDIKPSENVTQTTSAPTGAINKQNTQAQKPKKKTSGIESGKSQDSELEIEDNAGDYLKIYLKRSDGLTVNCKNPKTREQLRNHIAAGKTKFQWKWSKYGYEVIFGALSSGDIKLRDSMFEIISDERFRKTQTKYVE